MLFTLEDMDLHEDIAFLREHASRFLRHDRHFADAGTLPEADVHEHPADYFIAR